MDIFTTVLTRVVSLPIKPASLKVKALVKDAATGELKEDLDHVENHDNYFVKDKLGKKYKQQDREQEKRSQEHTAELSDTDTALVDEKHQNKSDEEDIDSKDKVKHLDLYV